MNERIIPTNESLKESSNQSTDKSKKPIDEKKRLAELRSLDILDTPADKYFARYTKLVSEIFAAPIVKVSLIDENREWLKSAVGMKVSEVPLEESFCAHALDKDMLEIPDTLEDEFFREHPLVVGSSSIRFYMGVCAAPPASPWAVWPSWTPSPGISPASSVPGW